jgi:hypothetical protein
MKGRQARQQAGKEEGQAINEGRHGRLVGQVRQESKADRKGRQESEAR